MRCPNCRGAMTPAEYEGVKIHPCDHCGGEFVGAGEIAHIVRVREAKFDAGIEAQVAGVKPTYGLAPGSCHRRLACPACGEEMMPANYAVDSGIIVDSCRGCGGNWLDSGELEKVQALLERWEDEAPMRVARIGPELERARRAAAGSVERTFGASRFAFVNAIINRLLDAA